MATVRGGYWRNFSLGASSFVLSLGLLVVAPLRASALDVPPVINSIALTVATLPPSGGFDTLKSMVTGATSCSIAYVPPIAAPTGPFDCSGIAKVTKSTLALPPNAAESSVTVQIQLTASAVYSDGSSHSTVASVHVGRKGYDRSYTLYKVASTARPTLLSCATPTSCGVARTLGFVSTISGPTEKKVHIDGAHTINAISCVAGPPMKYLAVDDAGQAM